MDRSRFVLVGAALTAGLLLGGYVATAEPRVFDLQLHGGELVAAARLVRVQQGDEVTLRWTTDRPVTIHLHGYDVEQKVVPGAPVSMRLTARATGRFAIDVHAHGASGDRTIGYLEVHPR